MKNGIISKNPNFCQKTKGFPKKIKSASTSGDTSNTKTRVNFHQSETVQLISELEGYIIDLEMQNEELIQTRICIFLKQILPKSSHQKSVL